MGGDPGAKGRRFNNCDTSDTYANYIGGPRRMDESSDSDSDSSNSSVGSNHDEPINPGMKPSFPQNPPMGNVIPEMPYDLNKQASTPDLWMNNPGEANMAEMEIDPLTKKYKSVNN